MEKKLLAAKAFEVAFTYQVEKKETKGELLAQDNKARLKITSGFGDKRAGGFELVSYGKRLKSKGAKLYVMPSGLPVVEAGGNPSFQRPRTSAPR